MTERAARSDLQTVDEAAQIVVEMREAVAAGSEHWFLALLAAVRRWPIAREAAHGREYRYLIGGEAFDWLLLAERLWLELEDLVAEAEGEDLLFHGRFPLEMEEAEFERLLGAKHRFHLNFVYGVRVEETLQLAIQEEVAKERHASRIWENGHMDDEICQRLYGSTRLELLAEFRKEQALPAGDEISLAGLREFTYWLFKHRVRNHDPARVASDTRKGVVQMERLEALRRRRLARPDGADSLSS